MAVGATADPFMLTIYAAFAQRECGLISQRTGTPWPPRRRKDSS